MGEKEGLCESRSLEGVLGREVAGVPGRESDTGVGKVACSRYFVSFNAVFDLGGVMNGESAGSETFIKFSVPRTPSLPLVRLKSGVDANIWGSGSSRSRIW